MSYELAYHTQFHSIDDTPWGILIAIDGFEGEPLEIKLEGDEPCVIEWQETGKTDVVQSSTCTLRVSNERDRQMLPLMSRPAAAILVYRDGKPYWYGYLDDAVYEEPYSYTDGYVTELTFSDFGILNRIPFTLTGRQSVQAIVDDCLASTAIGQLPRELLTSLFEPKTDTPLTLDMLYIDADRFSPDADTWGATTTKRKVLEEILRPLGLRIMQKNGMVHIYDLEYLRDHAAFHANVVWKGTDAYLRGSETFGLYEVAFDHASDEALADGEFDGLEPDYPDDSPYFAYCLNPDGSNSGETGFHIRILPSAQAPRCLALANGAKLFQTTARLSDTADTGIAWRAVCKKKTGTLIIDPNQPGIPLVTTVPLVNNYPAYFVGVRPVFTLTTGYVPVIPDTDAYQLRVSLDFLLSFRPNPFDHIELPRSSPSALSWEDLEHAWRQRGIRIIMVPCSLEVVDDNGTATWHYVNAAATYNGTAFNTQYVEIHPEGPGKGLWKQGPAERWNDMFLAYYGDLTDDNGASASQHIQPGDTDDCDPLVKAEGWTTNRQTLTASLLQGIGTLYTKRTEGEYIPLPPVAGSLRLTVGNGVFGFMPKQYDPADPIGNLYTFDLQLCYDFFAWQLYRNPRITVVKAKCKDDSINTDTVYWRYALDRNGDKTGITTLAGTWKKGLSPAARGLLSDTYGHVWENFTKNGLTQHLEKHLLDRLEDQTARTQPVITGTAELDAGFHAKLDSATIGTFLVTALRQDLHNDTEEVTMSCIGDYETPGGGQGGGIQPGQPYHAAWTDTFCVQEEARFASLWTNPLCTQTPGPFEATWDGPLCTQRYQYDLDWQTMQEET